RYSTRQKRVLCFRTQYCEIVTVGFEIPENMGDTRSDPENVSDDEFEVEPDIIQDPPNALKCLQHFAYYLVENIELNLSLCLNLLEEREVPSKSNSIHATLVSKSLSILPKIGSAVETVVTKGETFVLQKIDKKIRKL
ncbi:hypothetical protein NQ318_023114, partial [Aromia moschata]